jgi:hypothetical protein
MSQKQHIVRSPRSRFGGIASPDTCLVDKLLLIVWFTLALVMNHVAFLLGLWFLEPQGNVSQFKKFVTAGRAASTIFPCAISRWPFHAVSRGNPEGLRIFGAAAFALPAHLSSRNFSALWRPFGRFDKAN